MQTTNNNTASVSPDMRTYIFGTTAAIHVENQSDAEDIVKLLMRIKERPSIKDSIHQAQWAFVATQLQDDTEDKNNHMTFDCADDLHLLYMLADAIHFHSRKSN